MDARRQIKRSTSWPWVSYRLDTFRPFLLCMMFQIFIDKTEEEFLEDPIINWDAISWVDRPLELWIIHVVLALISFIETILLLYLNYKASSCPLIASHLSPH